MFKNICKNKTKVFSVKLQLDLKFWSNQNKVKFIFISHLDKCCMDKCHSETYPLILILLVRSMRQKYIWSKQCWSNNIEAKKKHLVPKNFSKIIYLSTKNRFWTQNFFRPNLFWHKFFLDIKFVLPNFFYPNSVLTQIFLASNLFGPKTFF